jgi:hypothetical protein
LLQGAELTLNNVETCSTANQFDAHFHAASPTIRKQLSVRGRQAPIDLHPGALKNLDLHRQDHHLQTFQV